MRPPPQTSRGAESRTNWTATIEERAGQRLVLAKVIAAIVEPTASKLDAAE